MTTRSYDLVVIGSGPAGEKGAAQAAYFGKRVALVEKAEVLGGAACTGTLLSKTLRETALTLSGLRSRDLGGLTAALRPDLSMKDLLRHDARVAAAERKRIVTNLRRHDVDLYPGSASFLDDRTVNVDGPNTVTLEAPVFLIASGSSPEHPLVFPFGDPRVIDSEQVPELPFVPRRLAIIGGGVIGLEYACIFAALGVDVHLVDRHAELLPVLDREVYTALEGSMRRMGVRFHLCTEVRECAPRADSLHVALQSGDSLDVDAVLVTTRRISNTRELNLAAAGVTTDQRGRIQVNEFFQTRAPHIYAAGDVIGYPALAATSMEQARLAMVHAFKLEYKKFVAPVLPIGIYTIPEISTAGETEKTLAEKRVPYVVGKAAYADNARGMIIGDDAGFLKLLFDERDMSLLGVAIVGEGASELVHSGILALMAEADHNLFIEACFNYPTLGQLYKYATYDAMGRHSRPG